LMGGGGVCKEGLRALHINENEIKTGMLSSLLIEGH